MAPEQQQPSSQVQHQQWAAQLQAGAQTASLHFACIVCVIQYPAACLASLQACLAYLLPPVFAWVPQAQRAT